LFSSHQTICAICFFCSPQLIPNPHVYIRSISRTLHKDCYTGLELPALVKVKVTGDKTRVGYDIEHISECQMLADAATYAQVKEDGSER